MATAPQEASLPLFYNDLVPVNLEQHANLRSRNTSSLSWLVNSHAVPLTAEEFPLAQRHYPIIFSSGENSVPLALMGLNEGVNVFVDAEGKLLEDIYLPAYVRRYPYMLVKLRADADSLSLCFDPTTSLIGDFAEGEPLFIDGEPSEKTKAALGFCEQFEIAGQKTANFVAELEKHGLLMDGELKMQVAGHEEPYAYSGFRMVDENKLREVRGDVLRSWNQSGLLALVYAHLFSLELARDIFGKQVDQGKGPIPAPQPGQVN